jgi:hypothetical protein
MAATDDQIAELRRLVAEPTTDTYSDEAIAAYIERYPCLDERGQEPYTLDTSTEPPTQDENESWIPTYDMHAAAADVWEEKAALVVADFDFQSDDQGFKRSQKHEMAMKMVRHHRSRRRPKTSTAVMWPPRRSTDNTPWIGNLPEVDD